MFTIDEIKAMFIQICAIRQLVTALAIIDMMHQFQPVFDLNAEQWSEVFYFLNERFVPVGPDYSPTK